MSKHPQFSRNASRLLATAWTSALTMLAIEAGAAPIPIRDSPVFLAESAPPLNMLVVGRDHKLYYEAYNDASDLNGDGKPDVGYRGYLSNDSGGIDYYGYFDSYKCYTYGSSRFRPSRITDNKKCGGSDEWSGDFLNYLTTSRIDALRKVLYGGKRSTDTESSTVIERSHIPMDAHSWGKEYGSEEPYDIREYAPLSKPSTGKRHLFANTTLNMNAENWYDETGAPLLRVLRDSPYRKWEWVSKESPVAGRSVAPQGENKAIIPNGRTGALDDYVVRVRVCVTDLIGREPCQLYPNGNAKPVGLLHQFGENKAMAFGLLTGSYTANKSGGVLRKNMSWLAGNPAATVADDEINAEDGTLTDNVGIIRTLDRLRIGAYTRYIDDDGDDNDGDIGGTSYDCGLPAMAEAPPKDGNCRMWGNPVAEMMYETLRYYAGFKQPEPAFTAAPNSGNNGDIETRLGLPRPTWKDPYEGRASCAKPFETVLADINPSYDTDQLPETRFSLDDGSAPLSGTRIPGLDVADLADQITNREPDVRGLHFIGQNGPNDLTQYDGAPTAKDVRSLGSIRGIAPEEPTKRGGYYSASVAYHGLTNDIHATKSSDQKVQTFAVALASPLPRIEIPMGNGKITLVPFAKSVSHKTGSGNDAQEHIKREIGKFQPTNQIVDFYITHLDETSGEFRVNFEDVEAGNDHDMDVIAKYTYTKTGNQLSVTVSSEYEAGSIIHHLGYIISGTGTMNGRSLAGTNSADGVYLEVQDCNRDEDTYDCNAQDVDYFLDTPDGKLPGERPIDSAALPGKSTRTFTAGSSGGATLLKDPLWYAAKWGGFQDADDDKIPDQGEWDANKAGVPDNYFLVTNALTLKEQLTKAFNEIIDRSGSVAPYSANSGSINEKTRIYEARFTSLDWSGDLLSRAINEDGTLGEREWSAASKVPAPADRKIITVDSSATTTTSGRAVAFAWNALDDTRKQQLQPNDPNGAKRGQDRLNYLRGARTLEGNSASDFRPRNANSVLGDILSSAPLFVGPPAYRYPDRLQTAPYSAFRRDKLNRAKMIYVGANDGMLHAFNAATGAEAWAFIPSSVFKNLHLLPSPQYSHRFYVDGSPATSDAWFSSDGLWHTMLVGGLNNGGQGLYALDITNPQPSTQAGALSLFKWEFTDKHDVDLGMTFSRPTIARMANGKWAAIFGNGYNNTLPDGNVSTTGNAALFIVDIETGQKIAKLDTGFGMTGDPLRTGRPNGLSTPAVIDFNGDFIVDYVYAGDLFGNLWKFDLRSTNKNDWKVAYKDVNTPVPLFVATDSGGMRQPITSRPLVIAGPRGAGMTVLFGTGKFLESSDRELPSPPRTQAFYGIYDPNTATASTDRLLSRALLTKQTVLFEGVATFTRQVVEGTQTRVVTTTENVRVTSNNKREPGSRGWVLDLLSPGGVFKGEMQITDAQVREKRLRFTTLVPDADPCKSGGGGWFMQLDPYSGGRLDETFDHNGDNKFDDGDTVPVTDENGKTTDLPTSGKDDDGGGGGGGGGPLILDDDDGGNEDDDDGNGGGLRKVGDPTKLYKSPKATGRQSWHQVR